MIVLGLIVLVVLLFVLVVLAFVVIVNNNNYGYCERLTRTGPKVLRDL